MTNKINIDDIEQQIPYYLSAEQKNGLVVELNNFRRKKTNYYTNKYKQEMLQGDGWKELDNIQTLPSTIYTNYSNTNKLFILSMVGFYLFVFKLSIHFCRFREDMDRSPV